MPSRLALAPAVRRPQHGPDHAYLDFVVDGRPLAALIQPGDLVGCLG